MNNLETQRITLRRVESTDLNSLKEILMSEKVMSYTGFKRAQTQLESQELITKWKTDIGVWVAIQKESNKLIGWFMLKHTISERFPEIGFMLNHSSWGKGYATEVASKLIDYAFDKIGYKSVIASVDKNNIASVRVLEKIGMKVSNSFISKGSIVYYEAKHNE